MLKISKPEKPLLETGINWGYKEYQDSNSELNIYCFVLTEFPELKTYSRFITYQEANTILNNLNRNLPHSYIMYKL